MLNRIKDVLYDAVLRLATLGLRQKNTGRVLIIKTDEIGDYMLWRKFMEEISSAEKFRNRSVHFCGNKSWKSIYETFDAGKVDKVIWFDKIPFKKSLSYRYRFLRSIYLQGYDTVINTQYSRDKRNDDAIALAAKASESFGMKANTENRRSYDGDYDAHLYTNLFDRPQKPVFEFYRNRAFTEYITGQSSAISDTYIPAEKLPVLNVALSENYFVVFPGSRSPKRIWPAENFSDVSQYLYEQKGWTAIVCGGPADKPYSDAFLSNYKWPVIDLTAKTSLPELLTVLSKAKLLLSVDTGSVHLAASVGCTVVGIFNGSQYGRFAPYPKEVADNFYPVYPAAIEAELADAAVVREKYEFVVDVDYADVDVEKVKILLNAVL